LEVLYTKAIRNEIKNLKGVTNMNQLPEGYKEIRKVDLTEDKRTFIVINIFSFIIFIAMAVLGAIIKQ